MFKALQRILLLAAWGILFAHSVVPHAHETATELTTCATSHEHNSSLLEALSHIFHFSTGQDHLEDFSIGSSLQLALIPAQLELEFVAIDLAHSPVEITQQLLSRAPPLINGLRAPPFRQ